MNKKHCRTCKKVGWFGEGQTYCKNDGEMIKLDGGCSEHIHLEGASISQEEIDLTWQNKENKDDEWHERNTPDMYGVPNH